MRIAANCCHSANVNAKIDSGRRSAKRLKPPYSGVLYPSLGDVRYTASAGQLRIFAMPDCIIDGLKSFFRNLSIAAIRRYSEIPAFFFFYR
jgi:hypothetical protein